MMASDNSDDHKSARPPPPPLSAVDGSGGGSVHPMVSVPEAVRLALRETARITLLDPHPYETVSVRRTDLHHYCGRILVHDVIMREPGYPPYAASIMDGYAVDSRTCTRQEVSGDDDDSSPQWTHGVREKVLTGDAPLISGTAGDIRDDESILLPSAYYITTGAPIPSDCDCVVPIEEVTVSADAQLVQIPPMSSSPPRQPWIRPPGCDLAPGEIILTAGTILDSIAVGLLLQSGQSTFQVRRPITVGVLSTGNELLQPPSEENPEETDWWKTMKPGTIPDVNRPVLLSLLSTFPNVTVRDLGMVRDDKVDAMVERIQDACCTCDMIVTTGGISMGETDWVEHVLVDRLHGHLLFGRLHMKPGKPTTLVSLPETKDVPHRRLVFALPGNPGAAAVCSHLLVGPCLHLLTHGPDLTIDVPANNDDDGSSAGDPSPLMLQRIVDHALVHDEVQTVLEHDIVLDMERPEYHRVIIDRNDVTTSSSSAVDAATSSRWWDSSSHHGSGRPSITVRVQSTGVQRSSRLRSMHQANGLLLLPQGTPDHPVARAGERFTVLLLPRQHPWYNRPLHQSHHLQLAPPAPPTWNVAVIRVLPNELMVAALPTPDQLPQRIVTALSSSSPPGSASGVVRITDPGVQIYTGAVEDLYEQAVLTQWPPDDPEPTTSPPVDLILILGPKYHGGMRRQLQLAQALQQRLMKLSPTLALQVRRGAASQDPLAGALWDVVVGYATCREVTSSTTSSSAAGALVVLLPEEGVDEALRHVRGLLKHAWTTARGTGGHHHH